MSTSSRATHQRAARRIARVFGVPFPVAKRTVTAIAAGRATEEIAALVELEPLPPFPLLVVLAVGGMP